MVMSVKLKTWHSIPLKSRSIHCTMIVLSFSVLAAPESPQSSLSGDILYDSTPFSLVEQVFQRKISPKDVEYLVVVVTGFGPASSKALNRWEVSWFWAWIFSSSDKLSREKSIPNSEMLLVLQSKKFSERDSLESDSSTPEFSTFLSSSFCNTTIASV